MIDIDTLIAEYLRRLDAIIRNGDEHPIPGLMREVLAGHPEVDIREFALQCADAIQGEAERELQALRKH